MGKELRVLARMTGEPSNGLFFAGDIRANESSARPSLDAQRTLRFMDAP